MKKYNDLDIIEEKRDFKSSAELLTYVLKIITDSRTKMQIRRRINGLLLLHREVEGDCLVYTPEMIKEYAAKRK